MDVVTKLQAQMAQRERVLDELASIVPVEAPEPLVQQEMERRLHDLVHRLEPQGLDIAGYLAATGQDQATFVAGVREGAAKAVLVDLGLRAVVEQEEIEVTDEEVDAEIERLAERLGQKPERVRRDVVKRGVLEAVRSDLARGKALEFVVDHATVVDSDGNAIDLTLPDRSDTEAPDPDHEAVDEPADEAAEPPNEEHA
jgi:trigger factor